MLDRNVHVVDELRLGRERVQQLVRDHIGVEVVHADPVEALNAAQLVQQEGKARRAVQVRAVAARVLRDDDQLLDAGLRKAAGLLQDVLHGAAAVAPAQMGDDAEGAEIVAALGDLDVGIVLRRREHAPGLVCRGIDVAELADGLAAVQQAVRHGDDVVIAACAEHAVDLRHLLQDLVLIALRQAACHEQSADAALLLQRAHGENVVDGLALGRVDKAAGVDDHEIRAVHILL